MIPEFAGNPYHHGYTFTTDMPIGTAGRWILDMMDKMDKQRVHDIWLLQVANFQMKNLVANGSAAEKKGAAKQIEVIEAELKDLRRGLLYYHEASTLENIHALGIEYIREQMRDSTTFLFDTQILNIRPLRIEDGFYPDLDEEHHGYFSEDQSYFDNTLIDFINPVLDCRKDKDFNTHAPLHIAIDKNRRIHPLAVAQDTGTEIRGLNGLYSLYPKKLKQVLSDFCAYYKPYKRRMIYYWYDHNSVADDSETKFCDEVMMYLRKEKFIVKPMYMGQAPGHEAKYRMWGHLLSEDNHYKKIFRINRENARWWINSMNKAEAEQRKGGFGKNKKPEQDPNTNALDATHFSDAGDMLVYGMLESKMPYGIESKGTGGIIVS